MPAVIQVKRGTASSWTSANTVLAAGEIGFETDTKKFKVGDGSTAWTSLGYTVTDGAASPLTTKGDLFTRSSSADARQAVGSDYGFLMALASETNGIKWNDGAWTTYTPTFTASSGTFTTTTTQGRYIRIGKFCAVAVDLNINTIGTASGVPNFTLPFTQANVDSIAYGVGRETAYTGTFLHIRSNKNSDTCNIYKSDGNVGLASAISGWRFGASIVFEVA